MNRDTIIGAVFALIVYVLGTYAVYRVGNDWMSTLSPWIGVLSAVIYVILVTVFFVIMSGKMVK